MSSSFLTCNKTVILASLSILVLSWNDVVLSTLLTVFLFVCELYLAYAIRNFHSKTEYFLISMHYQIYKLEWTQTNWYQPYISCLWRSTCTLSPYFVYWIHIHNLSSPRQGRSTSSSTISKSAAADYAELWSSAMARIRAEILGLCLRKLFKLVTFTYSIR